LSLQHLIKIGPDYCLLWSYDAEAQI